MQVWRLVDKKQKKPQSAFQSYACLQRLGASQPEEKKATECVGIRVVSFNFGMPQGMMSSNTWNKKHVFTFRNVLQCLGTGAECDFVFGSEVGDVRKGFNHKGLNQNSLDFRNVVADALPASSCSSSGAYLHVWNVNHEQAAAAVVAEDTWRGLTEHTSDMYWQAFDLTYRDAAQLEHKVGLLVGNMHIPVGRVRPPSMPSRRKIVQNALQFLTDLQVDAWHGRENFPIIRILVGDCNLSKETAMAVSQQDIVPQLTELQRQLELSQWQVGAVQFLRLPLESARRPNKLTYQRKYIGKNNKTDKQHARKILSKKNCVRACVRNVPR